MEAVSSSDEENLNHKNQNPNQSSDFDGQNENKSSSEAKGKPKRVMKTPSQLDSLEKAFSLEKYPSEETRAELSEKLGLSDRQLQMWFCHRRLKEKKETLGKMARKGGGGSVDDLSHTPLEFRVGRSMGSREMVMDVDEEDVPMGRTYYESKQEVMVREIVDCVEVQLGEPMREDGPILGVEFDPLPPDAFGAPMETEQQELSAHTCAPAMHAVCDARLNKAAARSVHEYQGPSRFRSDYCQVQQSHIYDSALAGPSIRGSSSVHKAEQLSHGYGLGHATRDRHVSQPEKQGHRVQSLSGDNDFLPHDSFLNVTVNSQYNDYQVNEAGNFYISSRGQIPLNDSVVKMKRKNKSGELTRKEIQKQDRERRKEEERLMRERQKAEERSQRELRREMERREKFLQREHLRAENRRKKEELRREREELKRRAAIEKANARRLAKESMELIEDEQLELMELAASSKGLPSIVHLDYETLQKLESFRDSLSLFPPKSVILDKPFAVQPWVDSDENIGNLLMVWRFSVAFADVLELWPFTLDEFIQALHDYDSRLLGEIHIALLKMIIKDIEDAATIPNTGLATNQSSAVSPEGGHQKIVEGAYTWGFDICKWRQHLNPLTWPEILRELALSAGFGPHFKEKKTAKEWPHDCDEIKVCKEIVSAIRNGLAAERAVAKMRHRGLLAPPRSRHRLTPGTLKFAAFHVLSLEGSKGLNLVQIADKVQKSGLRDLTKSKTPEASISVAMNRDTKLFERVAPSTYRVKSPYRKDPADSQAILAEARKKIQIFENGSVTGEGGDHNERGDEVERDEDDESECDMDEALEVDDVCTPHITNKDIETNNEGYAGSGSTKETICNNGTQNVQIDCSKELLSFSFNGSKDANDSNSATGQCEASSKVGAHTLDHDCYEIDESESGESWVQGLTEGDYSKLSVEERLNAVVALISIANEGNSIRCVLEDRLETANSLRKQMLADAQLDKSRLKDESIVKFDSLPFMTGQAETHHITSAVENVQSTLPVDNSKSNEPIINTENQTPLPASQSHQNNLKGPSSERAFVIEELSTGLDNLSAQQLGCASRRSISQLKSYIAHRAEEMYVYRSLPLGQDRRRNRYWQFVASPSKNDPGAGRIFVELPDGKWRLINSEQAFDALFKTLDTRGIREAHLHIMLQNIEPSFRENVRKKLNNVPCMSHKGRFGNGARTMDDVDRPGSSECSSLGTLEMSSFEFELGSNEKDRKGALDGYQDLQKWMWKSCFNSLSLSGMKYGRERSEQLISSCDICLNCYFFEDIHCPSCHQTFAIENRNDSYKDHLIECEDKRKVDSGDLRSLYLSLPPGIRLLKALLALVEVSIPPEGLESFWTERHRRVWGRKVDAASSTSELLQMLTLLESAVKPVYLRSGFQTTKALLGSCFIPSASCDYADLGVVTVLPWVPETIAAVVLKLLELDESIIYVVEEEADHHDSKETQDHRLLLGPASTTDSEVVQVHKGMKSDIASHSSGCNTYKHVQGALEQGYGSRGLSGAKFDVDRRIKRDNDNLDQGMTEQSQRLQSYGRGPRTVRKRRAGKGTAEETLIFQMANTGEPKVKRKSIKDLAADWSYKRLKIKPTKKFNWEEGSNNNVEANGHGQENWGLGLTDASNRRTISTGASNSWTESITGNANGYGNLMGNADENVDTSDSSTSEEEEDEIGEYMDIDDYHHRLDAGNMNQHEGGTDLADSDYYSD